MACINMKNSVSLGFLPLSNVFVDRYITKAKAVFVCIYIYSFKKCVEGENLTLSGIADDFDILESDVLSAWRFWKKEGIVDFKEEEGNFFVEFFDVLPEKHNILEKKEENKEVKSKEISIKFNKNGEPPNYSVEEINIYKEDNEVKKLFKAAERAFSSMLDFNKMKLVFGFYDWLGMSVDVIEYLIKYCVSSGKGRNLRYIESVAIDWAEREIDSVEKAEELVKTFNVDYREIMKAIGSSVNNPVEGQINYMKDWLSKLPLDIIKIACQKTVMATGKPAFEYADSIIQKWYKKGVKKIEDVEKIDFEFNRKKTENKNNINNSKNYAPKVNRFVNYEQRTWDFDALNKLKGELLDKNLKE